ncbi:flagellar protein FlgN [Clostridium sp.]|uniref:flagellar protein FlgN n=1 Tax=Clostridium sp. TaxID=1506 RepID=UPI00260D98AE|nr:flagellar protein FlgN [Clostridium sp.]
MEELKKVLLLEEKEIRELLNILENQHKLIIKKDIFGLEAIVEEIQNKNKLVAESEVNRRKVIKQRSLKEVVNNSKDEELDLIYRNIQKLLEEIVLQKETNDLLLKQQLTFTNRMLNIINPKREIPTYNSYGNMKR